MTRNKVLTLAALAAALTLGACNGIYLPGDPSAIAALHPGCSQHGYGKYDENAYPSCKMPAGTARVGGLLVKADADGKPVPPAHLR